MQQQRINDQLKRIRDTLEGLKENPADWVIMAGHYPVFSGGDHGDTDELLEYLLPLIEAYNVDVYLSGHDHISEHLKYGNTSYYVVGAGCMTDKLKDTSIAPLLWYGVGYSAFAGMTATAATLKIEFVDTNNDIKYTHTMSKQPRHRPSPHDPPVGSDDPDGDTTPSDTDKDNDRESPTKPDPGPADSNPIGTDTDTDTADTSTEPHHEPESENTDESSTRTISQIILQYMKNEINMHPELTIVSAGLFVLLVFGCVAPRLFYYVRSKSQKTMVKSKSRSSSKSHSKDNKFRVIEHKRNDNSDSDSDSDNDDEEGQSWRKKQEYRSSSKKRSNSITSDDGMTTRGHTTNNNTIKETSASATSAVSSGSRFMSLTTLIRRKLLSSQSAVSTSSSSSEYHITNSGEINTTINPYFIDEPLSQSPLSMSSNHSRVVDVASSSLNSSKHQGNMPMLSYDKQQVTCTQPTMMTTTSSDISLKTSGSGSGSESSTNSSDGDASTGTSSNHESNNVIYNISTSNVTSGCGPVAVTTDVTTSTNASNIHQQQH